MEFAEEFLEVFLGESHEAVHVLIVQVIKCRKHRRSPTSNVTIKVCYCNKTETSKKVPNRGTAGIAVFLFPIWRFIEIRNFLPVLIT